MTATCRLALLMSLIFSTFVFAADSPFDLVITNGHIIDGTGSPWYSGDVESATDALPPLGIFPPPRVRAQSTPRAKSSLPALSICSVSRRQPSSWTRACPRRSTRA